MTSKRFYFQHINKKPLHIQFFSSLYRQHLPAYNIYSFKTSKLCLCNTYQMHMLRIYLERLKESAIISSGLLIRSMSIFSMSIFSPDTAPAVHAPRPPGVQAAPARLHQARVGRVHRQEERRHQAQQAQHQDGERHGPVRRHSVGNLG